MTTIIFKETKKGDVKVAYDSQVSYGSRREEGEFEKVFVNNGNVFGVAGALRDSNILKYAPLPAIPDEEWDVDKWVVTALIPAMKDALDLRNASHYRNNELETDSHILVAVRGRVYEIGSDMSSFRNTDGVYAIGSGSNFVAAALMAGAKLDQALQIAAELDSGTGYGLKLTSTARLLGGE